MDGKKIGLAVAVLGLVTAVVVLLTAFVSLQQKTEELDKHARDLALAQQTLKLQEDAATRQREAEFIAQQRQKACDGHHERITAVEDRFSQLQQDHGVLLNFMRSCLADGSSSEDQQACLLAVCAGAAILANSNCVDVGANVASIKEDFERESAAAAADQCTVPQSVIPGFFGEAESRVAAAK